MTNQLVNPPVADRFTNQLFKTYKLHGKSNATKKRHLLKHFVRAIGYAHESEEREGGLRGTLARNESSQTLKRTYSCKDSVQWQPFFGAVREYLGSLATEGQSVKNTG